MSFSQYLSQEVLNYIFDKSATLDTQPTIHVALSTADPGDTGASISEPVGDNYARVATTSADWNVATDASPSILDNANPITFGEVDPAGDWGLCTHFGLFDALTSGNYLGGSTLGDPKQPTAGDTPRFAAGALDVSLT